MADEGKGYTDTARAVGERIGKDQQQRILEALRTGMKDGIHIVGSPIDIEGEPCAIPEPLRRAISNMITEREIEFRKALDERIQQMVSQNQSRLMRLSSTDQYGDPVPKVVVCSKCDKEWGVDDHSQGSMFGIHLECVECGADHRGFALFSNGKRFMSGTKDVGDRVQFIKGSDTISFIATRPPLKNQCPMPSHHHSCTCNGEGGDR